MTEPTGEHEADATNNKKRSPTISAGPQASEASAAHDSILRWLNQEYLGVEYHGSQVSIKVDDFLHIVETGRTDSGRSWLSEDQITLPMVLQLSEQANRSDLVIVIPTAAMILAAIGLGLSDRAAFDSAAPGLYEAMIDEDVKWIVVPCNDGMIEMLDAENRYKKAQETAAAEERVAEVSRNERSDNEALRNTRVIRSATEAQPAKEKQNKQNDTSTAAKGANGSQRPHDRPSKLTRKGIAAQGMHWGMMIIDKERGDARFFDGDLKLSVVVSIRGGKLRSRYRPRWPNVAIAAGKILRGYDEVMGRSASQFRTGTLRYTPHDHEHNNYKGDKGSACAPWVFALFRYILQNPTFLTNEKGLKGTFRKDQRDRHIHKIAFNSLDIRHDMQDLIAEQARKSEAASVLPHKLNTQILQKLGAMTPDVLLFHLQSLEGGIPAGKRSKKVSRGGKPGSGDSDEPGGDDDDGKSYKKVLLTDLEPFMSNDTRVSKEARWEQAYRIYSEAQKNLLDDHQNKRSTNRQDTSRQGNSNGTESVSHDVALQDSAAFKAIENHVIIFTPMGEGQVDQWLGMNSGRACFPSGVSLWEKKARLQRAFGGINSSTISKHAAADYRHHLSMDPGLGHMQIIDALRNLTHDVPNLRGQVQQYPEYYLREHGVITPEENAGGDGTSSTRLKQRQSNSNVPAAPRSGDRSSKSGNDLSDDDEKDDFTQGYRSEKSGKDRNWKPPSPFLPKPKKDQFFKGNAVDDDDDDDDHDNGNNGGSKLKRRRNADEQGNGGCAGPDLRVTRTVIPGEERLNNPSGSLCQTKINNPTTNNGDIVPWDNAHELPQGLLNFRTMSEQELEHFKDPEWLTDARLRGLNVNTTSWRAFHFAHTSGRHFSEENDADCLNVWLDDTVVFAPEERETIRDQGRIQEIRDRMNNHYCTGPPTETSDGVHGSDTEKDSEGDEQGDKSDKGLADTLNSTVKWTRGFEDDMAMPNKRKRIDEGESHASGSKKRRTGHDLNGLQNAVARWQDVGDMHVIPLNHPKDFRNALNVSTGRAASGASDARDSSMSSSLSSVPPSDDEVRTFDRETWSDSDNADCKDQSGAAPSGKKRRWNEDASNASARGSPSKKLKTSHQTSSAGAHGGNDAIDSNPKAPSTSNSCGQSATDAHEAASFDSQATVEVPTVDMHIGRTIYTIRTDDHTIFHQQDTTRNGWPAGAMALPDFATMTVSHWKAWALANGAIINPRSQQRGPAQDMFTSRALLHMHFRHTFMHEPDENFSEVWINDRTVFDTMAREELLAMEDSGLRNGEIRRRMMEAYEPEMLNRIETSGTYTPGIPNVVALNVVGPSRSMVADAYAERDEALLRPPAAEEARVASEDRRSREGSAVLRRSTRQKKPTKKYEG